MRLKNNTRATNRSNKTAQVALILSLYLSLSNISSFDAFTTPPQLSSHRITIAPPPPSTTSTCIHQKHERQQDDNPNVRSPSVAAVRSTNADHHNNEAEILQRRPFVTSILASSLWSIGGGSISPQRAFAAEDGVVEEGVDDVQVLLTGEVKKLFSEGRAREAQGNVAAAARIFSKVTNIAPKFIYGWSSLGNTQVALANLPSAEQSYTTAINLCQQSQRTPEQFGVPRCNDYYALLLNRGSLRLNNDDAKRALADLELSASLRGKPDALVLQNRGRAREINGLYAGADSDYSAAISMTSNEVTPVWLRSAMVKFQIGDFIGALDLARRVETKYPNVPEVMAAMAVLLAAKGDTAGAQKKLLGIPEWQRVKYTGDEVFITKVVAWPPKMIEVLNKLSQSVEAGSSAAAGGSAGAASSSI